jgi:beta-lactamase class A
MQPTPKLILPLFLTALMLSSSRWAQADAALDKPIADRAAEVQKLFRKDPSGYDKLFAQSFRDVVPDNQLTSIFTKYFKSFGRCTAIQLKSHPDAASAVYDFTFEKGSVAPVTLAVDSVDPHKIIGLLIGNAVKRLSGFDDVIARIKKLPGSASFLAQQLDAGPKPKTLAAFNDDKTFAIGSTFKLYILTELVREIEAGQRKWTDVVQLDDASKSLPGGDLHTWPTNSPFTLHTIAGLMISKSDNTATDLLLHTLGRTNVEAAMKLAGHSAPEKNMPFLSTLEMFKLKYIANLTDKYLAADEAARRPMLDHDVAAADRSLIASSATPKLIDKLEWFATAQDLCRVMNWLRIHTEKSPAAEARGILSINPGLTPDKTHFPFVGYKGGSELGVLNLTFLFKSKSNHWYALSSSWNNPAAPLDEQKFFELLQQSFELLD